MSRLIVLWKKRDGVPCWNLKPIDVDNHQALLDSAAKNDVIIIAIFDVTNKNEAKKVVHPR